jgi:hypothetical protein
MSSGLFSEVSGLAIGSGLYKGVASLWSGASGLVTGWGGAALTLDFLSGSLDSRVTFTRSTTATFTGSNGLIQTAAINTPRFDYDPVTLAPRGLLIEEQRTNLLTYSEQFDNAAWGKTDITVTANATTSPDGTTTADLLTEGSAGTAIISATATDSGPTIASSIYIKAGTATWVRLQLTSGANAVRVWLNAATGALGASSIAGTGVFVSATVTALASGWYRVSFAGTIPSVTSYNLSVNSASADGSATRVSGVTYYSWGAQLEAGAFATSYIPTVASQVTRSADVATMTGTNFSAWYNQSEGTFVVGVTFGGDILASYAFAVRNDAASNTVGFDVDAAGAYRLRITDNSVNQALVNGVNPVSANTTYLMAGAYKLNDFAVSANGGAVVTDTAGTVPTGNTYMAIGSATSAGAISLNGHIRSIAYYNTRLPNTTLQSLTAPAAFVVLDADGNSFLPSLAVLDSDGNSFTVPTAVLDSDGNSFTVTTA